VSLDRQELIAVLDTHDAAPRDMRDKSGAEVLAWRETLADAILELDKPAEQPVTDTGTIFLEDPPRSTLCNTPHPDFPKVICLINRGDHRDAKHRVITQLGVVEWPMEPRAAD
jgi:hypothetical protein